ncbi:MULTISPECIES: malto-oligosyltrehalose synthase [unclassified Rhizobium]|uniref:malto-oligosyltrehalose synthase n=1 Tax=unclassified Rhizobium TaxID=2613769 RepID=UPI0006FE0F09|nr:MULTISPECIES: malto-oligosyltrehalose synthase [unclassified Rhizobium]KQV38903.1 malto-oligosyltrehalose synthase [Rhizobium sp. Root1212]KRD34971.1 malto-oligosyltrehalose synthase [Rhizobium sp. Root268]
MIIPTATYRIQFRNGMTFDRAAELVPYLKRLGISHLYASPVFTATSGSTHGYDVTDANKIEPSIGGRAGFERMVRTLKAAGLGLILDIVPNHMAASLENPWWRDVVENGENSRYARHFDIDWSRKLTLPFLGDTFETVLGAGEISLKPDPKTGRPAFAYYETFYPLNPQTYSGREADVLKLVDKAAIAKLHELQHYRLMSWRDAPRDLSYRRFFEITGLAGIRVEDGAVFDDTHKLILELVHSGAVDGLRVDHVDGLADPKAYLEQLRREAGPNCYITVEKILGEGEHIPADWPISGTTGYEFISAISDALVDGEKLDELRTAYDTVAGRPIDMEAELRAAKLLMADKNFAGEVATLLKLARQIVQTKDRDSALPEEALKAALRELLIGFPVYRTYGTRQGLPPEGRQMLAVVLEKVRQGPNAPDEPALAFFERMLTGDVESSVAATATVFRTRFQQLTGPLMAKSVEDTLFFRQHMALALNEVGAEPLPRAFSLDRFHQEMQTRLKRQPDALSGTSTHDTKRGEDARARLYAITEAPEIWSDAVSRWRTVNRSAATTLDDGLAPEPAVEWMLYQALAGAWPVDLHSEDREGLKALEGRFIAYVEKALREAKLRTNWGDSNEAYEQAVIAYARHLLSPDNQAFLADFADTLRPFARAGLVNGITQTIIKFTGPGVPDIYQGSEGLDFSLVDPDNRREPDFAMLQKRLVKTDKSSFDDDAWASGRLKQHVIATLLRLRQEMPSLFRKGSYIPLSGSGTKAHSVLAYARAEGNDAILIISQRLSYGARTLGISSWQGLSVAIPDVLHNRRFVDVFTHRQVKLSEVLELQNFESAFTVLRSVQ